MSFSQSITPTALPKHAIFNQFWKLFGGLRLRKTSHIQNPNKSTKPTRSASNLPLSANVANNLAIRAGFTI